MPSPPPKKTRWYSRKSRNTIASGEQADPIVKDTTDNEIQYFEFHVPLESEVDPDDLSDENIETSKEVTRAYLRMPETDHNIKLLIPRLVAARKLRAGFANPIPHDQPPPLPEMDATQGPVELDHGVQPVLSTSSFPHGGSDYHGFNPPRRQAHSFPRDI